MAELSSGFSGRARPGNWPVLWRERVRNRHICCLVSCLGSGDKLCGGVGTATASDRLSCGHTDIYRSRVWGEARSPCYSYLRSAFTHGRSAGGIAGGLTEDRGGLFFPFSPGSAYALRMGEESKSVTFCESGPRLARTWLNAKLLATHFCDQQPQVFDFRVARSELFRCCDCQDRTKIFSTHDETLTWSRSLHVVSCSQQLSEVSLDRRSVSNFQRSI